MNTLSWADQSAAAGDYADAIAWLDIITAIGDDLPEPYPARRVVWRTALGTAAPPARGDDQGQTNRRPPVKPDRAAA